MKKIKITVKICITICIVSLISCIALSFNSKYVDCGVIIDKYSAAKKSKYKLTDEQIFIVKYNDGFIDDIRPTINDYYKNEIGSKVCYSRTDFEIEKLFLILLGIFGFSGLIFSFTVPFLID